MGYQSLATCHCGINKQQPSQLPSHLLFALWMTSIFSCQMENVCKNFKKTEREPDNTQSTPTRNLHLSCIFVHGPGVKERIGRTLVEALGTMIQIIHFSHRSKKESRASGSCSSQMVLANQGNGVERLQPGRQWRNTSTLSKVAFVTKKNPWTQGNPSNAHKDQGNWFHSSSIRIL